MTVTQLSGQEAKSQDGFVKVMLLKQSQGRTRVHEERVRQEAVKDSWCVRADVLPFSINLTVTRRDVCKVKSSIPGGRNMLLEVLCNLLVQNGIAGLASPPSRAQTPSLFFF